MKLDHSDHFLIPLSKINSNWVKDPKVRPDAIKSLEEKISRIFFDINCNKIFFDQIPKENKSKTKKQDLIKLKPFTYQRKS